MFGILWTIATILVIWWILSFFVHAFALGFGVGIHALIVIAIILFVVGFVMRGRTTT